MPPRISKDTPEKISEITWEELEARVNKICGRHVSAPENKPDRFRAMTRTIQEVYVIPASDRLDLLTPARKKAYVMPMWVKKLAEIEAKARERIQLKAQKKEAYAKFLQAERLEQIRRNKKAAFLKQFRFLREKGFCLLERMEKEKIFSTEEIKKEKEKLLVEENLLRKEARVTSSLKRIKEIFIARISGGSLKEIGAEYNITRERVRQITTKEFRRIHDIGFHNVIDIMDDNKHKGLPFWHGLI